MSSPYPSSAPLRLSGLSAKRKVGCSIYPIHRTFTVPPEFDTEPEEKDKAIRLLRRHIAIDHYLLNISKRTLASHNIFSLFDRLEMDRDKDQMPPKNKATRKECGSRVA
ncbi:MAG: hypothetical protein Q9172_007473 [Xanthocarpia lactea]